MTTRHQQVSINKGEDGATTVAFKSEKVSPTYISVKIRDIFFSKAFDYDDISGVYLGPRRAFDDEDLEYLCKELEDPEGVRQGVKQERPQSPPLIVDSVSGIST